MSHKDGNVPGAGQPNPLYGQDIRGSIGYKEATPSPQIALPNAETTTSEAKPDGSGQPVPLPPGAVPPYVGQGQQAMPGPGPTDPANWAAGQALTHVPGMPANLPPPAPGAPQPGMYIMQPVQQGQPYAQPVQQAQPYPQPGQQGQPYAPPQNPAMMSSAPPASIPQVTVESVEDYTQESPYANLPMEPHSPIHIEMQQSVYHEIFKQAMKAAGRGRSNKTHRETGGVLIGTFKKMTNGIWEVSVDGHIAMDDGTLTEFTITQQDWQRAIHEMRRRWPQGGKFLVGVYHTHPGHTVFHSGPDMMALGKDGGILREDYQFSLVLDHITRTPPQPEGTMGIFVDNERVALFGIDRPFPELFKKNALATIPQAATPEAAASDAPIPSGASVVPLKGEGKTSNGPPVWLRFVLSFLLSITLFILCFAAFLVAPMITVILLFVIGKWWLPASYKRVGPWFNDAVLKGNWKAWTGVLVVGALQVLYVTQGIPWMRNQWDSMQTSISLLEVETTNIRGETVSPRFVCAVNRLDGLAYFLEAEDTKTFPNLIALQSVVPTVEESKIGEGKAVQVLTLSNGSNGLPALSRYRFRVKAGKDTAHIKVASDWLAVSLLIPPASLQHKLANVEWPYPGKKNVTFELHWPPSKEGDTASIVLSRKMYKNQKECEADPNGTGADTIDTLDHEDQRFILGQFQDQIGFNEGDNIRWVRYWIRRKDGEKMSKACASKPISASYSPNRDAARDERRSEEDSSGTPVSYEKPRNIQQKTHKKTGKKKEPYILPCQRQNRSEEGNEDGRFGFG